ncbi:hypothetical protein BGZ63DRAFT_216870 [Mariannaea sp. PMI_226]|nr:hypothetical protein BGZ63DRAFT_216870 [Mariannaea sp. PMI_226]
MSRPPSTPAPRKFLLANRGSQSSQTPAGPPQFYSTPRFGSSSVLRSTQGRARRDIEDVEEVEDSNEKSSQEEEDEGANAGTRRGGVLADSIEIESDPPDASYAGSDGGMDGEESDAESRDSIVPESLEPFSRVHGSSPLQEREPKRRRVSISPIPYSLPTESNPGASHVGEDDAEDEPSTGRQSPRSSSIESFENIGAVLSERRILQQPTFHAPPRFKPTEADNEPDGLPAAFSPQRRGAKYLPDGLAAGLQGWLSDIKGWGGTDHASGGVSRVTAEEVRPGRRMYLVKGRAEGATYSQRFLLAGEGKLTGLGRRAVVSVGSVIHVEQPVWDVKLEGEIYTVCCNWSVC